MILALLDLAHAGGNFIQRDTSVFERCVSFLGIFGLLAIAWALSTNRSKIQWRPVIVGVSLQLVFAFIVLMPALQEFFFTVIDGGVRQLLSFSEAGAEFVFQTVDPHEIYINGEPETFIGRISPPVRTFAFWILPTIVFFSSLMAVLYHLRVMQPLIKVIARVMQLTMGTSGAESLAAASNIFVGQTEAPLVVKPFIEKMTKSELHALMTGGFATVAGGVMAAYVGFLQHIPGIAGHLVTASILSAPAALAVSKLMFPEVEQPVTLGVVPELPRGEGNVLQAAADGAAEGMKLALNVAAMLIAFVGLMAMADWMLTLIPVAFNADGVWYGYAAADWAPASMQIANAEPLSLSRILGWLFTPFALLMGVPWDEAALVGTLLGEKIVLTEFIAYIHLGAMVTAETPVLSERSAIIASYALCGFANFASIGIQLGGIGGIAPSRMKDISSVAVRAMIAGTLAAFMTATIAGVILG